MKLCESCDVTVNNPVIHCPLCYSYLTQKDNKPEAISYPDLSVQAEAYNIVLRILLFLSLTAVTVCFTINLLTYQTVSTLWSLAVFVNIAYAWIAIGTAVKRRKKLGMNILIQAVSLSLLMLMLGLVFDFSTVVFNYVLPALFISATVCITIIVIVKHMDVQSFVLYFLLTAVMGFVPLLFVAFKLATVSWPAYATAVFSTLSLVSLFIFADNATKKELRKRFHV